jgi:long-chain fatty acid transport protein
MKKKISLYIVTLIILTSARQLNATGFAIYEMGARAAALAGAFTAKADDASAISYNPAGLAFLDGFRIKTNIQYGTLKASAFSPHTETSFMSNPLQIQGLHYIAWSPLKDITFGFGRFTPYSTDTEWNGDWPGNRICVSSRFASIYLRSALAVKLLPGLALGVGMDVILSRAEWSHNIDFQHESFSQSNIPLYMDSRHYTQGTGIGFVSGLMWKIGKRLQIGGKYQHKVNFNSTGSNTFHDPFLNISSISVPGPDGRLVSMYKLMRSFYKVQDITFKTSLPREIILGIMLMPVDRLTLLLDLQWTQWSDAMKWEFQADKSGRDLNPEFMEQYADFFGITPDYGIQSADMSWIDTWNIKFGMEFHLSNEVLFRAGYATHPSAVKDNAIHPVIPDLDKNLISLGFGYAGPLFSIWDDTKLNDFSFDIFVQYMFSKDKTSSLPGYEFTFDTDRLVIGLGVGFVF